MLPRVGMQARLLFVILALIMLSQSALEGPGATLLEGHGGFKEAVRHLIRPNGASTAQGLQHPADSNNWSGYVVTTNAGLGTPQASTAVTGNWVVPKVSFVADGGDTAEYSANWIGIGGANSQGLIQVGTEQDVAKDGSTRYYAWTEILPASQAKLPSPYTVAPGDLIGASIICVENCAREDQTWQVSITDQTAGWTFTTVFYYGTLEDSAEWIVEAPYDSESGNLLPLANFDHTSFSAISANGVNPNISFDADANRLTDPAGQTAIPSQPSPTGDFTVCWNGGSHFASCSLSDEPLPEVSPLVSAVLPTSRSVLVGQVATIFATIVNPGPQPVTGCTINAAPNEAPSAVLFQSVSYQPTDPSTNTPIGTPNSPVSIPAGGSQSFLLGLTRANAFSAHLIDFTYTCNGDLPAAPLTGINTLLMSASMSPTPDVIALVATEKNDGILHLPGVGNASAFAMATDNVGVDGALTLAPNTGNASLPLAITICQTDANSVCMATPAPSVTLTIAANAQPTFSVFATANGSVPFSPAASRIFLQFTDAGGVVRGSSSVAVTTDPQ